MFASFKISHAWLERNKMEKIRNSYSTLENYLMEKLVFTFHHF